MIAYEIIEKLWRLNRIFCSSDYDESLAYLQTLLPFNVHKYECSSAHKGWVIPPKWDLVKGVIKKNGRVVFEVDHPLKIIGLSSSFIGMVSLEELKKHLFYDHRDSLSIPYHFRQHYRPWERNWGFCVSKQFYDELTEGVYAVEIITKESDGCLKIAEFLKEGIHEECFVFVAHLDHPGMANDDLSGVAVGVDLFRRLSQMDTKFSYRLVLVQEIIGSVFYLDHVDRSKILESCFLEMLGTRTPLSLQHSRYGKTSLEQELLKKSDHIRTGCFRSIVCNDEVVWESHNIPMCTLSRYPYPEYHSDKDNLSIISPDSLEFSVILLQETIKELEKKTLIRKKFEGVFSLAHPDYNLYIDSGQPAFTSLREIPSSQLRVLMDEMPLLPKYTFVDRLATDLDLPFEAIMNYLILWQNKNLISLL